MKKPYDKKKSLHLNANKVMSSLTLQFMSPCTASTRGGILRKERARRKMPAKLSGLEKKEREKVVHCMDKWTKIKRCLYSMSPSHIDREI